MAINWIPISGIAGFLNNEIIYDPDKNKKLIPGGLPAKAGETQLVHLQSDQSFTEGEISFEVKVKEDTSICKVVLGGSSQNTIYIGINSNWHAYGITQLDNNQQKPLASVGDMGSLPLDEWINIKILVKGSIIELIVNGVRVCATYASVVSSQVGLWLHGQKEIRVKNTKVITEKSIAFVVMQFTQEFDELYDEVIKPVCEEFNLLCVRADDIYNSGPILSDIINSIQKSSLIIADITPDNPNVFYEVGFAHGTNKATILLSDRKREKLPFDVSGMRTIFYDNSIGGKRLVEERLRKHLENLMLPQKSNG